LHFYLSQKNPLLTNCFKFGKRNTSFKDFPRRCRSVWGIFIRGGRFLRYEGFPGEVIGPTSLLNRLYAIHNKSIWIVGLCVEQSDQNALKFMLFFIQDIKIAAICKATDTCCSDLIFRNLFFINTSFTNFKWLHFSHSCTPLLIPHLCVQIIPQTALKYHTSLDIPCNLEDQMTFHNQSLGQCYK